MVGNLREKQVSNNELRQWYLARLRKRAVESGPANLTPAGLVMADSEHIRSFIASKLAASEETLVLNREGPGSGALPYVITTILILGEAALCLSKLGLSVESVGWCAALWILTTLLAGEVAALRKQLTNISAFLAKSSGELESARLSQCNDLINSLVQETEELREREYLIAEFASDVTCCLDPSLRFVAMTQRSSDWGLQPIEVLDKPVESILLPDQITKARVTFDEARKVTGEHFVELRIRTGTNHEMDTSWLIEWSHQLEKFFVIVSDISEAKALERLREEFLTLLSHDLRSPIINVLLTLKVLASGRFGAVDNTGQKRISDALAAGDFLMDMIADIIDINRVDENKLVLDLSGCDVRPLIEECLLTVSAMATAKGIEIRSNFSNTCELTIDRVRLKRVIVNLLANAIKFSPPQSTVEVATAIDESTAKIEISDSGPGLTNDALAQLFQRYFQACDQINRKKGFGLGLFASRLIVEAHGGSISAFSKENNGAVFAIVLPRN